jgi:hypothetical protein
MSLPQPKLDDKNFEALVDESVKLIPRYSPEWTDHNRHDPGLTLIELFAWLTEMQQFYLDSIAPQSYLKFLKLLGTKPQTVQPARTEINFRAAGKTIAIPRGTKLTNTDLATDDRVIFETESSLLVLPVSLRRVLTSTARGLKNNTGTNDWDGLSYYAFGEEAEINSRLYLGFDAPFPAGKKIALTFDLVEDYEVPIGKHGAEDTPPLPSALVIWEYYNQQDKWAPLEIGAAIDAELSKREDLYSCCSSFDSFLTAIQHETTFGILNSSQQEQIEQAIKEGRGLLDLRRLLFDPAFLLAKGDDTLMFSRRGRLFFRAPSDMGQLKGLSLLESDLFWLRATVRQAGFELAPQLDAISINTIGVLQRDVFSEVNPFSSNGMPDQTFVADSYLATFAENVVQVRERDDLWTDWQATADLAASTSNDRHYVISKNAVNGTAAIEFGNGAHGRIPPKGENQVRLISYLPEFEKDRDLGVSNGLPNQFFALDETNVLPDSLLIQVGESVKLRTTSSETETIPCLLKFSRTTSLKTENQIEVTVSLIALAELCDVSVREQVHGDVVFVSDRRHDADSLPATRNFTVGRMQPGRKWEHSYLLASTGAGGSISGSVFLRFASNCEQIVKSSPVSTIEINSREELRWRDWIQVDDFDASGPGSSHFVFDPVANVVRFGDGINGDIPPPALEVDGVAEANIRIISLATCEGENGNVVRKTIDRFADANHNLPPAVLDLKPVQPIAASSGKAAETLDESQTRARVDLRTPYHAVTSDDFECLAINTPGLRVARAKAIPCYSAERNAPEPATVSVVVLPFSTSPKRSPSENFLLNVCRHLDRHRLITTNVEVVAPNYVRVSVHATVTLMAGFNVETSRQAIIDALNRFLRPVPAPGDKENQGWPFGRTVFKSEIFEVIKKVNGVDCVETVVLTAEGAHATRDSQGNITISPTSVVFSGDHQIDVLDAEVTCRSSK